MIGGKRSATSYTMDIEGSHIRCNMFLDTFPQALKSLCSYRDEASMTATALTERHEVIALEALHKRYLP